ncbi:MAG TPA: alginate lyase family protein [Vicinamibacteria bacterium]|nr:alginate lyase family protein [Vicinamibacteria bacterium]
MTLARAVRLLRRPPGFVARRAGQELRSLVEPILAPRRARAFDRARLLQATRARDLDSLWAGLAGRPLPGPPRPLDAAQCQALCPGEPARVRAAAVLAVSRRVQLLGSAPTDLGTPIDWARDFKTGLAWPSGFFRRLPLVRRDDLSDVKVPWELSRLQWLLPAGQAYLLDGDEAYARAARSVLEEWIGANPYAMSVNWGCAMEAALRVLSWTWLFHAFHASDAWGDAGFRSRFLCALYLHAEFTERYIERSDVNGNHYAADTAGLVVAGLFFGEGEGPERWQRLGWEILSDELPRQVLADGVDFEASSAYHRLVLELFLLPALYRRSLGQPVPDAYRDRLVAMARLVEAYTRPDGSAPLWGDADDGRALPLGGQDVNDHRYLVGLVGSAFDVPDLVSAFAGPRAEVYWLLGPEAAARLPEGGAAPRSAAFPEGGVYVLRNAIDHVFVDCGPVGMAGRGGHGHNDALSFEAHLLGRWLVADCGTYTYSGDFVARNRFRGTRSHNTPQVDGAEINRLVAPDVLWELRDDARPEPRRFEAGGEWAAFVGAHSGYRRLDPPVTPVRTLLLHHARHALVVRDVLEGRGPHRVEIPLHLAPGVGAEIVAAGRARLLAGDRAFLLAWGDSAGWGLELGRGQVSPSYGVLREVQRLAWHSTAARDPLIVCVLPEQEAPEPLEWARALLDAVDSSAAR